jgi:hypothetical protein
MGTESYIMAEARAQHEPSGLWHYLRGYGPDELTAELNVAKEALRRNWVLDRTSVRTCTVQKGAAL